jgi:antitoxin component YwqK of YwqJK toxin-antitoxin module
MGLMLKRTTYKNGKIVSAMEITQAAVPPVYEEKFYDESGRITHSYIYRSHTDELVPEYTTEYVYGENGKLASTSMYYHAGALKLLTIYEEYGENGHPVKKEVFSYDGNFEEGEYTLKDKTVNFYDENGNLIKAIYYIGETIYKEEIFTYNENGKIIKKVRHDYADGEICSSYETHIDELGRYTYYSEKHNNGASHEEITEYRGDRVVKNEIYHNGELYQRILLEFNEKDLLVRHLEQYTNSKKETIYKYNSADLESEIALYVNDKLTERTVFEYHKNGMQSSIIKYDANGNATSKTYFDTNGSVIETC